MKKLFSEVPRLDGERIALAPLNEGDADALRGLCGSEAVYRWLPTFLFEQKYEDKEYVIKRLYDECLQTSLILGVYMDGDFCGLAEIYGYRAELLKASVGYRLSEKYWGRGIATEALGLMQDYLLTRTDVRFITASTMVDNKASANVLRKNGFRRVFRAVPEDWGRNGPTLADKWVRTGAGYRFEQYRFHI